MTPSPKCAEGGPTVGTPHSQSPAKLQPLGQASKPSWNTWVQPETGELSAHSPELHLSLVVQASWSLQAVPSAAAAALQLPLVSHVPISHWPMPSVHLVPIGPSSGTQPPVMASHTPTMHSTS